MRATNITRRDFSARVASAVPALGLVRLPFLSIVAQGDGISHNAESIHQEVTLKASSKRIYDALLDDKLFNKMTGGMATTIAREAGGAFSLFGERIKGRNIELVTDTRIVQAWRSEGWDKGDYSLARFQLVAEGTGTKIVFDHTGFPKGQAEHLAAGWKMNYWDSLEKFLA